MASVGGLPVQVPFDVSNLQAKLDGLADYLRPSWSPSTHAAMPHPLRKRAYLLLLVGQRLWATLGLGFRDLWMAIILPHALADFQVVRQGSAS